MSDEAPYGPQRLRRSLSHFLIGKGVGALIGLIWLFSLVRVLPTRQYGAYFAFYAYVEVMILLTGWGIVQMQERFIPENYARHDKHTVYQLAYHVLAARVGLLLCGAGLVLVMRSWILGALGLDGFQRAFLIANGVLIVEGLCRTIDSYHDALLLQWKSQLSILTRNFGRVGVLLWLLSLHWQISVRTWLELELSVLTISLLLSGALFLNSQNLLRAEQPVRQYGLQWRRYFRFSMATFSGQLLFLMSNVDVVKLIINKRYGLAESAIFGFCLSLALIVQRYLPTYLLVGMVRPLFVVTQYEANSYAKLRELSGFFIKLNLLSLVPLSIFCAFYENSVIAVLSGSRFITDNHVLLLLLLIMIAQALRNCVLLVTVAQEDAKSLLVSTGVSAALFVPSAFLLSRMSVLFLLMALLLSEVGGLIYQWARCTKFRVRIDIIPRSLPGLIATNIVAIGATRLLLEIFGVSLRISLFLGLMACGGACVLLLRNGYFSDVEKRRISRMIPASCRRLLLNMQ